jgi:acetyl esterase/lipase
MAAPAMGATLWSAGGWRSRGIAGWLLSALAAFSVLTIAMIGFAMIHPVRFDSLLGLLGAASLIFPLHLLIVAAAMAGLAFLARAWRARLAAALFTTAALLSTAIALWPSLALWRFAEREDVGLSLGDYIANANHLNLGPPQLDRSVVYSVAPDGTKLLLDVWPAAGDAGGALRPAFVRVHGGAFIHGNRSDMPDWDRWFNRLGYDVFDIEYRLPPPVRWRDEIGDVKCALGWVVAHAGDYGVDPARISVTGFSAGATLAMLAAYSAGDPRVPPSCSVPPVAIRSVVNLYGVSDMPLLYDTSPSRAYVQDASVQYIGGSPAEFPDRHAAVSPLTYIGPASPPTISFLGANDRIVVSGQLYDLDDSLKRAGATSEVYLLPASDHGFDVNWGGFATQFARAKIREFLRRYR